jgi:hypothetical protein
LHWRLSTFANGITEHKLFSETFLEVIIIRLAPNQGLFNVLAIVSGGPAPAETWELSESLRVHLRLMALGQVKLNDLVRAAAPLLPHRVAHLRSIPSGTHLIRVLHRLEHLQRCGRSIYLLLHLGVECALCGAGILLL